MNLKLLGAAIRIIPKRMQGRALVKALNYILTSQPINLVNNTKLRVAINDLNREWWFVFENETFSFLSNSPSNGMSNDLAVSMSADIETILLLKDDEAIKYFINKEKLTFDGAQKGDLIGMLKGIPQNKIDELIERGYGFLKLKRPPRLDINSVSISDVRTPKDVEFLRDEAIRLENDDLKKALALMEIAFKARPEGPLIRLKVKEYRAKVSSLR